MPFLSKAQMRLCYRLNDPNWDCDLWLAHTPNPETLPERAGSPRRPRSPTLTGQQIFVGPRGGRYYIQNGKKYYV